MSIMVKARAIRFAMAGAAVPSNSQHGLEPMQARSARPADAEPLIAAYHECLARCLEAGDVSDVEAHRIAADAAGDTIDALADRQVANWCERLNALPLPDDPAIAQLRNGLIEIVAQSWLIEAAKHGWDAIAVFGCHPHAPLVRGEAMGLAVTLAGSPHARRSGAGQWLRTRLIAIDHNQATIETPTGARFRVVRFAHGLDYAIPVWELPVFANATRH